MTTFSSWPYPRPEPPPIPEKPSLRALLLCPTEPQEHFNRVRDFIWQEGTYVCRRAGITFKRVRIMDVRYPGIITQQIWDEISYSDIIFLDLSGLNPNVLIELGVASAWRSPFDVVSIFNESIHLLRVSSDRNRYPHEIFDVAQLRHIRYDFSTDHGVNEFMETVRTAFLNVIGSVPREWPSTKVQPQPMHWEAGQPLPGTIQAPPRCHFNLNDSGLSFGAPYYWPASYIRVTRSRSRNCVLETRFRFKPLKDSSGNLIFSDDWVGIKVRASNTFADYGHLVYVRRNGKVVRVTIPAIRRPGPKTWDDKVLTELGTIDEHDWITLKVESTDRGFIVNVAKNNEASQRIEEIPTDAEMVEFEGYPLIQTHQTRAILNRIYFEPKDSPPRE
jgi:hypothetical protein